MLPLPSLHRRRRTGAVILTAALLAGGLAAVGAPAASAADTGYFVDCDASTPGDGTAQSPWDSLSAITAPAGGFGPGDAISLRAGTVCTGSFEAIGDGAAGAPVVLGSYGEGAKPVIAAGGASEAAVTLRDVSHWRVEGISVTNDADDEQVRSGILIEATGDEVHAGIEIVGNDIADVAGITHRFAEGRYVSAGILVKLPAKSSGARGFFDGVLIEDNSVREVRSMGIALTGSPNGDDTIGRNTDVVIRGNVVTRAAADSILVGVSDSPLIERNVSYDAGYDAPNRGAIAGIWAYTSIDPVFQFNESARTQPGPDSMGWDCDWGITGSCTYQYNYSHENAGGFYLECLSCAGPGQTDEPQLIVRYNVSQNEGFVNSANGRVRLEMYNNTLYNPDGEFDIRLPANTLFANNILVGKGLKRLDADRGITVSHNLYSGFAVPASDAAGVAGDPLFVEPGGAEDGLATASAYALRPGSPALDAGLVISGNGGRDYFGNPVSATAAPHIGAFSGAPVTAPPLPEVETPVGELLVDGGFEAGVFGSWRNIWPDDDNFVVPHTTQGDSRFAMQLSVAGHRGVEQTVAGLQPNTDYVLTGYARVINAGEEVRIGVYDSGTAEAFAPVVSTDYQQVSVPFRTGASATSAKVYCLKETGLDIGFCDTLSVRAVAPTDPGTGPGPTEPGTDPGPTDPGTTNPGTGEGSGRGEAAPTGQSAAGASGETAPRSLAETGGATPFGLLAAALLAMLAGAGALILRRRRA